MSHEYPPLPEPYLSVEASDYLSGKAGRECLFTADQLHSYAAPLLERIAELEGAVAAEQERWRSLLEARAAGCERAAENTEDPKFDAMARVLMSVREDGFRA